MTKAKFTTFYIVRHGETDWNVEKKIQGHTDIPLNANGKLQAKEFAESLKNISFDLAFSSEMLRAKETAEIIALEHKLEVQTTKALRERQFGKLEGVAYAQAKTYFALLNKLEHTERFKERVVDDAESDEDMIKRLMPFLRETAIANPGKRVLVATHGGILRVLLIHLGQLTYKQVENSRIANTAHIVLSTDGVDFFVKEVVGVHLRTQEFTK